MDIKKLTAIEKVRLVMGADFWSNDSLDGRLYKFVLSDGPVGLRHPRKGTQPDGGVVPSIAYPSSQVLSQTWNKEMAYSVGKAIANDCIEQDIDVILGPAVNIKRNPLCGRNFEYYSEDPYLAGTIAREYISGVQSMNVGTCLKHFCCNNMEFSRHWASMEVDERTLREIYLKPFEIACKAKPWTIMCSYNLVNGRRMSENEKLYDIAKNEFGFDGLIMSDWDAVKDPEASLNAGLSLEMPYNERHHNEMLKKAEDGLLDEEKLNTAAQEVIHLAEKCEEGKKNRKMDMSLEERRGIALKVEEEGIVLLKNKDNVLPLKQGKTVLVTGAPAFRYYYGGGSSNVTPELPFTPLADALKDEGVDAEYSESIWEVRHGLCDVGNVKHSLELAVGADYTILAVGDPSDKETEAFDRQSMKLTNEEEIIIHEFAKVVKNLIIVIEAGAPIDMSSWIDEVSAVVYMGYGGEFGHKALSEVLTGKVNPSGKLSETFPIHLEDVPSFNSYHDGLVISYQEGLNVGYRYFETFDKPVLFSFGYGLSYSTFEYSNMEVEEKGDDYLVSFDIENTSSIDGKEIAQIYVSESVPEVYRPKLELKDYTKVFVKAHEKVRVSISLLRSAFSYYSVAYDSNRVKPGTFEILVGKSSHDIVLSKKVLVK